MIEQKMKAMRQFALAGALAIAGLVATPAAHAEMLMTDSTTFISGTQSTVYTLFAPTAGIVNVKLTDFEWPERFANLSFAFATASGVLAELDGPGSLEFEISAPGTYFGIVSGTAQGSWNVGLYSLHVGLGPLAPAVPLPPALGLLLMGLASTFGLTRNRHQRPLV